jgi:phosphoglycolate phosphatase-like HAD superfamily hydrolase
MVLCGDRVKKGKPDPEILRAIMARFKVKPGQTVYVGDMFIDVQTAVRAGCHSVAVTTGSSTRAELKAQRPEVILPAARCLTQLLT